MRSKNIWIVVTIVVIWLVVLITSLSAPELTFGDEPVVIRPGLLANWFWGLLGTVFVMRSSVFRRPNELGWGQTDAWPWVALIVGGVWIIAMIASLSAPDVTITDDITIPVAAVVAPPIAAALSLYTSEFLITGFAARKPVEAVEEVEEVEADQ